MQHYDWGDPAFLANLQSRSATGRPEAEVWFGAHPSAPSILGSGSHLDEVIAADPASMVGAIASDGFGRLPFLAKILAAARPLSLQTHPSTAQAQQGFERENALGIPLDGETRIYRDKNHKPELICALTTFEAKVGFRSIAVAAELFGSFRSRALAPIVERLEQSGSEGVVLAELLEWLLRLDDFEASALVHATVEAASSAAAGGPFRHDLAWTSSLAAAYPGQIGVVVALLLNHVRLDPGQAVFMSSGNLHMYLQGAGVEVMANSDNVIRGGLTSKHVDIDELLRVVDCSPVAPPVQAPEGAVYTYDTPAHQFAVTRIEGALAAVEVTSPEILVVTDGVARLGSSYGQPVEASAGEAVWVSADHGPYEIEGAATLYRVTAGRSD